MAFQCVGGLSGMLGMLNSTWLGHLEVLLSVGSGVTTKHRKGLFIRVRWAGIKLGEEFKNGKVDFCSEFRYLWLHDK